MGKTAVAIQADISSHREIEYLFSEFSKHFSRLDLFVNNAGITKKAGFLEKIGEKNICPNIDASLKRAAELQ